MKVLQREGSAPAAMVQDKQTASLQGSSLRPSHSFKLKDRSSSAPSKTQAMTSVPHRHSVPSTGKAINESDETDGMGHDVGPSNITDTISVSLESLDAVIPSETHFLEEEPDLMLGVEEQETWSATVDRKTLKKMTDKDVRRQDTIWELIQTEKQYVKRLKIMQKLLRDPMLTELGLTLDQTERLFPRLDELFELHAAFLRSLLALQTINEDRSVDEIGLTLLKQFADTTADRMKSIYGVFCSKHTEAIQLYKEIAKTDRKFQNFCRKTCNLPVCEKREVPDLILGVTVRLSKYPILIETIFKRTKDKKDREQLSQALQHSKVVVNGVDAQVASYEKLMDIYRAFDSRTTMYQNKKFKRQDLMSPGRRLLHAGHIGWKTARSRVIDIYTVVLTDIMVFLQKNEQKYTFFLQDNKSCVVPLNKLLVREKRDERDSHGIYVISQNKTEPEMYELVCRTRDDRDNWLKILQDAIKSSPEEEEIQQQQTEVVVPEEERRKQEEKSKKVKDIIDQLHQRDSDIKTLCEQKNHLMLELMEFSAMREDGTNSRPSSQYDLNGGTSQEVVQAAMQEASRLTTILQGPGSQLSRSVSSAGEHVSMSYVNVPMPKRAETFAGFDTSFEAPKSGALLKKRFIQQYGDEEGRCPSDLSLHNADTIPEDSVISTDSRFGSQPGLSPQSLPSSSNSSLPRGSPQAWDTSPGEGEVRPGMDISDHGSMGELSVSSVSSLQQPAQPTSAEQMLSVVQLVKYLHNLMNLTAKQTTTVECLRAELGEAKEEISKLSQDMHGQRRSGSVYRHNQLEELRNIQENIRREREEWEREKEKELEFIRQEKNKLDIHKRMLDKNESELRSKKDDLWRQREALQRQIDMMRDQGLLNTLTDTDHVVHTIDLDNTPSSSSTDPHLHTDRRTPPGHRRSASADFNHRAPPSQAELEKLAEQRGMPRHARGSVTSLQNYPAGPPPAGGGKQNVPLHLMSTRNEQRMGGSNMQKLPMKLSSSSLKQQPQQQQGQQHMHPRTASLSSLGARPGGGTSPVAATPTPQQAQGMITKNQNSRSTPSNLAMVMKLAEPGAKGKGSGGQGGGGGQSGPGAPRPPSEGSPDKVIYF
ncbi:rho guanine nucleotide exchange factor 18-like isoform X2 [Littorina saxatilis]|uniref:rho guanine nucleotide exchange factor 18-like isoform X2 n=1 Tax=Littorina saxatilis TaxID=31220 RepID=UPI0038B651AF